MASSEGAGMSRGQEAEAIHDVQHLPDVRAKQGKEIAKCGTETVRDLARWDLGKRGWGDLVDVRPGDREDDDTPR